jgi:tagaturonate epimerase
MLKPVTLGLQPSFGFGDRLGLATPGHAEALRRAGSGIAPIFAQQSIREMARTNRTPEQVMKDACTGAIQAGFTGPMGADADHLKQPEDVDRTAAAGFVFFTIDPSDAVDPHADNYSLPELQSRFAAIREEVDWLERYRGREWRLTNSTVVALTEETCLRAAVKYGRAINRAVALSRHIDQVMTGRDYEIELSVDETEQPTTLAEHWIIAEQCLERGMKLVSLAPRYVGDFEKGVDYQGSLEQFERSLADHAAVANQVGPYKLSLHSGSDKLSIYSVFARLTRGRFHVKTAGTSYLEALRVVARHEPALFRRIVEFARGRYDTDRASYHVSAAVDGVPSPADVPDGRELERLYLELWSEVPPGRGFTAPGRQILHCTFGSVLTDPELGPALRGVLEAHLGAYEEVLAEHFQRHLAALQTGL